MALYKGGLGVNYKLDKSIWRETGMSEDETPKLYKFSLTGPGVSISQDLDQSKALAMLHVAWGENSMRLAAASIGQSEMPADQASLANEVRKQPLSLREFLEANAGRSNPTKIATIGRFMRDHENQGDFGREDVRARFRTAGEPLPGNFARDFQAALQAGWIAEDHQNRGRFYVTRRGDDAIERHFEGDKPTTARPRRRRRGVIGDQSQESDS
jgi:hypothetical protein